MYQPYESDGLLPYNQFSLRLSKSDIPHIVAILRAVPPDKLRRMRLAMAKYYRWDIKAPHGDAPGKILCRPGESRGPEGGSYGSGFQHLPHTPIVPHVDPFPI